MAAVAGVSSSRSARMCRSSCSLAFLSSGLFDVRLGLSSVASATGTAVAQARASHQKLVRGTKTRHNHPRTNRYNADCQLIHDVTSLFPIGPCAPVLRLVAALASRRSSSPGHESSEANPGRSTPCSRLPSSVCPRASFSAFTISLYVSGRPIVSASNGHRSTRLTSLYRAVLLRSRTGVPSEQADHRSTCGHSGLVS